MNNVAEFINKYSQLINNNKFKKLYKNASVELTHKECAMLTRMLYKGLNIDSYEFAKQCALEEFYNALMKELITSKTIPCTYLQDFVTSHWCPTVGLDVDEYSKLIFEYLDAVKDQIYVEAVSDGFGNIFIQSVGE